MTKIPSLFLFAVLEWQSNVGKLGSWREGYWVLLSAMALIHGGILPAMPGAMCSHYFCKTGLYPLTYMLLILYLGRHYGHDNIFFNWTVFS